MTGRRYCVYCGEELDRARVARGGARSTACRSHAYLLNRDPRYALHMENPDRPDLAGDAPPRREDTQSNKEKRR